MRPDPFFQAIAESADVYDHAGHVVVEDGLPSYPGLETIDARPGSSLEHPGRLLAEIARLGARHGRTLLVFDPLDAMARRWGADIAGRFFVRACPTLLEGGAIAYWSMQLGSLDRATRHAIEDVTQCVLVLRDDRLRIAKAEGRGTGVQGSVHRVDTRDGVAHLAPAPTAARLGAALRAVRQQRGMTQRQLAEMAGVSPSAMSQAERGTRGLSLDTLLDLTARLNITVDELLRGQSAPGYRLGRRDDPAAEPDGRPSPLLDDASAGMRAYLIRLAPGGSGKPQVAHKGTELIAVVGGLVQVVLSTGRPVLRPGDVLMADRDAITGWRNIGHRPAALQWIIRDET
jgi:transcriptional regulator with XRE-family HTH domain